MKNFAVSYILLMQLFAFLLLSCGSNQENKKAEEEEDFFSIIEESHGEKTIYYRFPSPEEIMDQIEREDINYSQLYLNPVSNADDYLTTYTQSLNLGVYISDLAFITLFDKLKDAQQYLETIEYLSDKIRVNAVFNDDLNERIRSNIHNLDSLIDISRETYNDLIKYLDETDNNYKLAVISAGAYVEALYLVLQQVKDKDTQHPIFQDVYEQKHAFNNLIKYIENQPQDQYLQELTNDLKRIQDALNLSKEEKKSGNSGFEQQGDKLVLGGTKTAYKVTPSDFSRLKNTVFEIRSNFIRNI